MFYINTTIKKLFISFLLSLLIMFPTMKVSADYEIPADNTVYCTASALNVRSGPGTSYEKVGLVRSGDAITVTGTSGNWYQIVYNDTEAYISAKYTTGTPISSTETTDSTVVADTTVTTTGTDINNMAEAMGSVTSSQLATLNNSLSSVPANIRQSFINNGWHIYVTTDNLGNKYYGGSIGSVRAVTNYVSHTIEVETRTVALTESAPHEMGHYLDYMCGWPSLTDEFTQIYNEEVATFKSRITNSSCVSSQSEFFAEIFHYICVNPSKCTPRAQEYVSRYIGLL